jgi:hypothetical protein
LDTGFDWSGEFETSGPDYRNIALYVLYQLFPLVCLVAFFVLETYLVIRVLGEFRPMCTYPSLVQGSVPSSDSIQCISVLQLFYLPLGKFSTT